VLRKLTISNIENIKKYRYLKNGAMYSILVLGIIMIVEVYGVNLPPLISPIATFLIVGFFFLKSKKEINQISK